MDISKINNSFINNILDNAKPTAHSEDFQNRLEKVMKENDKKELKKVCQDFEAIMLNIMYKQMKATINKSDLVPEDAGRDVFESMLDESLVEEASKSNGFGLGDTLYKQLSSQLDSKYHVVDETKNRIDEKK